MKICFIDEAGDLGALRIPLRPNDQPVFTIAGLFIDVEKLADLTEDFLTLKYKYFPRLPYISPRPLDRILLEIKGAELRKNATRGVAKQRSHAIGFLDRIFGLLRHYEIRLVARVWVKGIDKEFNATSVYTSSIQGICSYFERYLSQSDDLGICIADSRYKINNVGVSHSIFTQKFSPTVQRYQRLAELPTFGHSENHVGLQLCDIVSSALLFPIACFAYCTGHVSNVHVQPRAEELRSRYGQQLKALQYRYRNPDNLRYEGGLVVSDAIGQKSGALMFG